MGAGRGRHWEVLVQRFRVSACAGVDKSRIQDTAGGRAEEEEDSSVDQKRLWVEHILIKEEGEGSEPGGSETDFLLEEAVKVDLDGPVTKEELGRSTWTFLHTLAAQFPLKPTKQEQRDAKELMAIISRLYPCKTCSEHFKEVLKTHPPKTNSGAELSKWMCKVHNIVNKRLGKPEFPCAQVDFKWGTFDCDGACSLHPPK